MAENLAVFFKALLDGLFVYLVLGCFFEKVYGTKSRSALILAAGLLGLSALYTSNYGLLLECVFVALAGFVFSVFLYHGSKTAKFYTVSLIIILFAILQFQIFELQIDLYEAAEGAYGVLGEFVAFFCRFVLIAVAFAMQMGRRNVLIPPGFSMPKLLILFPLLGMLSVAPLAYGERFDSFILNSAYTAMSLFLVFAGLYALHTAILKAQAEVSTSLLKQQLKSQLQRYEELEIFGSELSRAWHDFRNHMIALDGLLDSGNVEEAKAYLTKIGGFLEEFDRVAITGNLVFDSILAQKSAVAKDNGIVFGYSVRLPQAMHVDAADLCVVLGNILDNAIEACIGIQDIKSAKEIKLKAGFQNDSLYLMLENSAEGAILGKDGRFAPSKKKGRHGIGMKSVEAVVIKYGGHMDSEYTDGKVKLRILLQNTPGQ